MFGLARSALQRVASVALPSSTPTALLVSRGAASVLPSTTPAADVAPADSGRRRQYSSSPVSFSMEEFFPPKLKEGEAEYRSGRPWTAAELRLKSFEDLHRLWFVCLKEQNMLLSDRLYYRQVGQAAPRGADLGKVKRTMARIKVVLWERARAEAAYEADQARLAKLSPTDAAKTAAAKKMLEDSKQALPIAKGKKQKTDEVTVTFKRFGRKHTVPASLAPEKLTRQQRRRRFAKGLHMHALSKRSQEVRAKWEAIEKAAKAKGESGIGGPKTNSYANLGGGGSSSSAGQRASA